MKWALLSAISLLMATGLGAIAPRENADQVAFGRKLFFDNQLSADNSLSCATCHVPELAFSDGRVHARGIHGIEGERNSPTLINVGSNPSFFWDGRETILEQQTLAPIFNARELGLNRAELERRTGRPSWVIGEALASYVRTIRSSDSSFDRYLTGNTGALNAQERSGLELFRGKAQCVQCHSGPDLTDDSFHDTGVAWKGDHFTDEGRFVVTRDSKDHGSFRTPTLREVARTAPYMHDGSLSTLEQVVEFYAQGGRVNPSLDVRIRPLNLTVDEKRALVAFLKTLSGKVTDGL